MRGTIDRIGSLLLTAACIVMAVAAVRREVAPRASVRDGRIRQPERVAKWRSLAAAGILVGDPAAPIKILEFADFECPFCKASDSAFRVAKRALGAKVALVYVHYPLSVHRFAIPAARAAECAAIQGRFAQMHDLLFDKQDSLGLKPWPAFANDAGVADSVSFARCIERAGPLSRIEAGKAAGRELGITGTPTVLVNEWRFPVPPSAAQMIAAADDLLVGKRVSAR